MESKWFEVPNLEMNFGHFQNNAIIEEEKIIKRTCSKSERSFEDEDDDNVREKPKRNNTELRKDNKKIKKKTKSSAFDEKIKKLPFNKLEADENGINR